VPAITSTRGRSKSTSFEISHLSSGNLLDERIREVSQTLASHFIPPTEHKQEGSKLEKNRKDTSLKAAELQKAIEDCREKIKEDNTKEAPPIPKHYFRLVNLLTMQSINHPDIISILDSLINGPFKTPIKINALMKKALFYKMSSETGDIIKAFACSKQARELTLQHITNKDEIQCLAYLIFIDLFELEMMQRKKTVEQYITPF
jgi:hypothetical protein